MSWEGYGHAARVANRRPIYATRLARFKSRRLITPLLSLPGSGR